MSFTERLAAERRLIVLQALDEAPDRRLNERALVGVLGHFGHTAFRIDVRAAMQFLAGAGLVRIETLPDGHGGEVWIGALLEDGREVAQGRAHPGVARPTPR